MAPIEAVDDFYNLPLGVGMFVIPMQGDKLFEEISGTVKKIYFIKNIGYIDIVTQDNISVRHLLAADFSTPNRLSGKNYY